MKNKKGLIAIGLAAALLIGFMSTALYAAGQGFPLLDKFMKADFDTKKKVVEHLREKYPNLRYDVARIIRETDPKAPNMMRAERMQIIAEKYPNLPVKVAKTVLKEAGKKSPHLIMDIAIDITGLISGKYPGLAGDIMKWRSENRVKSKVLKMIREKHPGLLKDAMEVLASKDYPAKIASLKADLREMMAEKHPGLRLKIKMEVAKLVMDKYPELPEKIAAITENPDKNPRFAIVQMIGKEYPGLFHEALKTVRDKHGSEINRAVLDGLNLIDSKYPTLITDLGADMSSMLAKKHPTLFSDLSGIRSECGKSVAMNVMKKYPGLRKDVKSLLESKYAGVGKDIMTALQKEFPGMRDEMAQMRRAKFGGLMEKVRDKVSKEYPKLIPEVEQILQ